MHNTSTSRGLRRRRIPVFETALVLLSLAGCQSFQSQPDPSAAVPVPPTTVLGDAQLEPIEMPNIRLATPIVVESDLLTRIRTEFTLPTSRDASVERELTWYARHQPYLDRVFERGDRYLFYIVEELEARNMPLDLALLPIVESAFDPFAYSHGRASGLWQIIPGTGKRLGLRQNWWFDGRRDIVDSTRAALDYLEQLHKQFGGDWLLAIAGYNSGEGNVARALKRAAVDGKPGDFWGIKTYLPPETRTYVPRLLAIRDLVADPAKHGVTLPTVANEAQFAVIPTSGQIDMALAARLAGIDTESLYALNAGVNRWATDPEGPHRLLIPLERADHFTTELAAIGDDARVQWSRHRVAQGETVGGLAARYQTTAAVLREVNKLRGNTIRAGDYLLIPHALHALDSYSLTADARAERQQNTPRSGVRSAHVVKAGESLWSISRRYGVDVRALARWNSMAPGDVLSVGRELVLWTPGASVVTASAAGASNPVGRVPVASADEQVRRVTYVVRRGDSLYSIAQRFRVTVPKLIEWNKVAIEKYLQPGQRLVMFVNVLEQST